MNPKRFAVVCDEPVPGGIRTEFPNGESAYPAENFDDRKEALDFCARHGHLYPAPLRVIDTADDDEQ